MPAVIAQVQPGETTKLQVEDPATPGTFIDVAEVTEIDGPEVLIEAVDATALNSGIVKTRPSYFPEPGKLTLKIWYDPQDTSSQPLFIVDFTTPHTIRSYKLQFNNETGTYATGAFHAFQTSFKLTGMKVKSNLEADIELQLVDLPVFTVGTGLTATKEKHAG